MLYTGPAKDPTGIFAKYMNGQAQYKIRKKLTPAAAFLQ